MAIMPRIDHLLWRNLELFLLCILHIKNVLINVTVNKSALNYENRFNPTSNYRFFNNCLPTFAYSTPQPYRCYRAHEAFSTHLLNFFKNFFPKSFELINKFPTFSDFFNVTKSYLFNPKFSSGLTFEIFHASRRCYRMDMFLF